MSLLQILPFYLKEHYEFTLENKFDLIRTHVDNVVSLIKKYKFLTHYPQRQHVTHFFNANDYESRLSQEWRNDLDAMSLAELIRMVVDDDYFWGQSMNHEENYPQDGRNVRDSENDSENCRVQFDKNSSQVANENLKNALDECQDHQIPSQNNHSTSSTSYQQSQQNEQNRQVNTEKKWCASLQEFVVTCRKLKFRSRNASNGKGFILHELNDHIDELLKSSKKDIELYKGMSPKKVTEVALLSNFIHMIASEHQITTAIDIGSGRGYLSHVLAVEHGLEVIGIDNNNHVAEKANAKVQEYEIFMRRKETRNTKSLENDSIRLESDVQVRSPTTQRTVPRRRRRGNLRSLCSHIESNMNCADFLKMLGDEKLLQEKTILIGLHTCGNLAPTTLKLFANSETSAMVNVGCCYHKLSEKCDGLSSCEGRDNIGFPISTYLREIGVEMTTGARDLGCLATTKWNWRDLSKAVNIFIKQSYRWVLDDILLKYNCKPKGTVGSLFTVGNIPVQDWETFGTYMRSSVCKMIQKNKLDAPQEFLTYFQDEEKFKIDMQSHYESFNPEKEGYIHSVAVWWCIRGLLGSLVEELILLDRVLFLEESGCDAELIRLFPPIISPRGYAIVGKKKNK